MTSPRFYDSPRQFLEEFRDYLGVEPDLFLKNHPLSNLSDDGVSVTFYRDDHYDSQMQAFHVVDGMFAFLIDDNHADETSKSSHENPVTETDGFITIYIMYSGNFEFRLSGEKHDVKPGEAVIFKRTKETAKGINLEPKGKILSFSLSFSARGLANILKEFSMECPAILRMIQAAQDPYHSAIHLSDPRIQEILNFPLLANLTSSEMKLALLKHKIAELLILLSDTNADTTSALSTELSITDIGKLDYIRTLIEENFYNPPPLKSIMSETGFSRKTLTNGFRMIYGATVDKYAKTIRLKNAKLFLTQTDFSIAEIADKCGYENPNNFTRAFKNEFGITPREFRKN